MNNSAALPEQLIAAVPLDAAVRLPDGTRVEQGGQCLGWTLVATPATGAVVWEDFSSVDGSIAIASSGTVMLLSKTAVTTQPSPNAYLGFSLEDVMRSEHDILGRAILGEPGDPDFDVVADALPPIRRMPQYSFVASRYSADKVAFEFGGRSASFDPGAVFPRIQELRAAGTVLDGLVGGWLPVTRFVYPEDNGWFEYIAFAPAEVDHPTVQRVWHRIVEVRDGKLIKAGYHDTYPPHPPRDRSSPAELFFDALIRSKIRWEEWLGDLVDVDIPDRRFADQARAGLLRAIITRVGDHPKYGIADRMYGSAEHDGFQDTFNADVTASMLWGLHAQARRYIDDYLTNFVRDDGSLWYRGPETGQYGRMLTVIADYVQASRDQAVLIEHGTRIRAIVELLTRLHDQARGRDADDPAFGVISGYCEADSCLEADPGRYRQPYLSNSAEAARGLASLARALRASDAEPTRAWGEELGARAVIMLDDLQRAISRSVINTVTPACLPVVAGAAEPFHVAVGRDSSDPQFRAYRANMELLFSGVLDSSTVDMIIDYREAHRDLVLGVPCAYGMTHGPQVEANTPELAGFLSYGHAYGLLQHGRIREFLLCAWSLSAHQYTRGSWTAPETRLVDPSAECIGYAVPAQLVVPMLLRWMLVFEEPMRDTLHLARGIPTDWFADGQRIAVTAAPTRWGPVTYVIGSQLAQRRIAVRVSREDPTVDTVLHLRLPDGCRITGIESAQGIHVAYDPGTGSVFIPVGAESVDMIVHSSGVKHRPTPRRAPVVAE